MPPPEKPKSLLTRILEGLKEGFWKLLMTQVALKIVSAVVLLATFIRPLRFWLAGLLQKIVDRYWPPEETLYFTIGGFVVFVSILGIVVWRRTRSRREDPVEAEEAKWLIKEETRFLTLRAKKRDPKAHAICASKGWTADTRRDKVCRRTFGYGLITWGLYSGIVVSTVTDSFAVTPRLRWKSNVKAGNCVVIVRSRGRTVAFGIVDDIGMCNMDGLTKEGEVHVLVYRLVDGAIEWSEMTTGVSKSRSEVFIDFPKYRCPLKVYGPFMFQKNGDQVISADVAKLREAQGQIGDPEGLVVIEGRTCDEEFPSWDGRTNFSLSMKRCESISLMLDTTSHEKRIVLPLRHDIPLYPQTNPSTDEERSKERNARILVLMRSLADDKQN